MKKNIIVLGLTLLLICGIMAGLLAVVNFVTKDRIEENISKNIDALAAQMFDGDIKTQKSTYSSEDKTVKEVYGVTVGGVSVGYLVRVSPKGSFGGDIDVLVGIKGDGSVAGVRVLSHSETPGFGSKAIDEPRLDREYNGKTGPFNNGENVDFIAGATYSSTAINNAVNSAHKIVQSMMLESQGGVS